MDSLSGIFHVILNLSIPILAKRPDGYVSQRVMKYSTGRALPVPTLEMKVMSGQDIAFFRSGGQSLVLIGFLQYTQTSEQQLGPR